MRIIERSEEGGMGAADVASAVCESMSRIEADLPVVVREAGRKRFEGGFAHIGKDQPRHRNVRDLLNEFRGPRAQGRSDDCEGFHRGDRLSQAIRAWRAYKRQALEP